MPVNVSPDEEDEDRIETPEEKQNFKERFNKAHARSLKHTLEDYIWHCDSGAPAEIQSIQIDASAVAFQLRWPFYVPAVDREDDLLVHLNSPSARKKFKRDFQKYLLKQNAGKQLSFVFFKEFVNYLILSLGYDRYGAEVVAELQKIGERRGAGKPEKPLPAEQESFAQKNGKAIRRILLEIRRQCKSWSKTRAFSEEALLSKIIEQYGTDRYPWMRYFDKCFRELPVYRRLYSTKDAPLEKINKPTLLLADSWSASALAARITQALLYEDKKIRYPLHKIQHPISFTRH